MKIAYVYDAVYPFTIGGVEKRIAVLSERLAARGHEVHVFGLKSWEGDPCFSRNGVQYHGVGHPKLLYKSGRRSIGEAVYFGLNVLIPLSRERFDIIDCQNFPYFSCFSVFFVSRIRKTPLVITWHEVWDDYWDDYLGLFGIFGRAIERLTARLSCNLVAVSGMTENDLKPLIHCLLVTILPNGIDIQHIDTIQPSGPGSDILFVGRLIREKNPDLLIEAISIIFREFPGIRCIIVGDGPEKDRLTGLIKEQRLEDNVIAAGFMANHDDVIGLMKASKVFVSPSFREGFGMAALEAMACGLPVVTINAPKNAVKELVTGKTGIICDPSPESFAEAVHFCLERKDSMVVECKTRSLSYDWEKIVTDVEGYYSGITGKT